MTFEDVLKLKPGDKIIGPDNQVHIFRHRSDIFDDILRVGNINDFTNKSFHIDNCQLYYIHEFNDKLEEILDDV